MTVYKKKISVGAFLKKGEDFEADDIIEIASEGKQFEGQYGTQDIFMVKLKDGREGNVSFNQTTINNLIDGYDKDSINWIGKKAKVWAILSNVQGKMIKVYYFLHPDTVLNEESGEFTLPTIENKDSDSSELPDIEEESPDDIPF